MEDAEFYGKDLALASVDLQAAFDRVEKFAKEIALARTGIPDHIMDFFREMDKGKSIQALSAYGVSGRVLPETGATAQGAVESPVIFVLLMSWLCAYMDRTKGTEPYDYTVEEGTTAKIEKMEF